MEFCGGIGRVYDDHESSENRGAAVVTLPEAR